MGTWIFPVRQKLWDEEKNGTMNLKRMSLFTKERKEYG
jgi:hypothetical protein